MDTHETVAPGRMLELDWIRVIVTINLIPFHVAWMMTSVAGYSFVEKWTAPWKIIHGYMWFVSPLHMYLLLMVAGTAAFHSLRGRSPGQYVIERIRRLLVPLLAFMIFLFPVLGYFWPPAQYEIGLDYLSKFWPWCLITTFNSPVTGGPNWGHMWFVGYLFIYSLAFLPLLVRFRSEKSRVLESMTDLLTGGGGRVFIAGIPLALTFFLLAPIWLFFRNNLYSDWGYFTYNLTAFLAGFVITRDARWMRTFERHAVASLILGIAFSAAKLYMQYSTGFSAPAYNLGYAVYSFVAGFNTWFWVIAILSFARRGLSFSNRFLVYFNKISYPFYIFHLVAISVSGYFITRLRLSIVPEFLLICAVSFSISVACCELVKRTPVTRFLLGIKGG